MDSNETIVTGQIVHLRKLSKKMMFVDIIANNDISDSQSEDNNCLRKNLVFKFWDLASCMWDKTNRGDDKLHHGDIVQFHGTWHKDLFSVRDYTFINKWSDISKDNTAFKPIPPINNKHKSTQESNIPCKYFVNTGKCETTNCAYLHETNSKKLKSSRNNYVQERIQRRILEHEIQFDDESISSEKNGLHPATKRCEEFTNWLVNQYGDDYLRSGIILDVAGGRGDLAFELAVKRGYNCQIVDPRPQKLKRWQVKLLKKNPDLKSPVHHTRMFDKDFFQNVNLDVKDVKLIIGMHPDEATECIIDIGLLYCIPVSFVPCCVFSALFPNRRLSSGDQPTSLPEFIQYLCEKSSNIQIKSLPFIGRNQVLFSMPNSNNFYKEGET